MADGEQTTQAFCPSVDQVRTLQQQIIKLLSDDVDAETSVQRLEAVLRNLESWPGISDRCVCRAMKRLIQAQTVNLLNFDLQMPCTAALLLVQLQLLFVELLQSWS